MGPGSRPLLCGLLSGILLVLSSGALAGTGDTPISCLDDIVAQEDGPGPASVAGCGAPSLPVATTPGVDPVDPLAIASEADDAATATVDQTVGRVPVGLLGASGDGEAPRAEPADDTADEEEDTPTLGHAHTLDPIVSGAITTFAYPLDTLRGHAEGLLGEIERTHLQGPTIETTAETKDETQTVFSSSAPVVEGGVPDAVTASLLVLGGALATSGLVGLGGGKPLFGRTATLLRRIGWLAALPLFSKIDRDDVLDHPLRDQLVDAIRSTPGVTVQELRARFGLGYGTIVHHLRVLEHHHLVSSIREGRHRRLFLVGQVDHSERPRAALLANPKTGRIYALLSARP
ncbi:MAG: ArsR family transcriptional regulator, partial [Euryarchaeota archaeon]|nr:ArsR family transcriptional regulator [Euryarchaeota archaeon]